MTVAALEAAPALEAGAAPALEARPAARAARARAGGTGRRAYAPRHQAWAPLPPPERARPRGGRGGQLGSFAAGDLAGRGGQRIHRGNYQGIVLAEFVAAVLLVALIPFAGKQQKTSMSPYAGKDMLQLGGITVLYFVLALISAGNNELARLAAWLGGLVLLTVGLASAAHLAQVIDLAGIGSSKAQATADQEAGT
jgi:hypothetical protein